MPHVPQPNQEHNGNSDADRARLIARISNPELRRELEEMVAARDAALAEVKARQAADFERDVAAAQQSRAIAARSPAYRGFSWPTTRDAAVQAVQVRYRAELENLAKPFNEKLDERLEPHRQDIKRRMANDSRGIHEERLQQSATQEAQSERERSLNEKLGAEATHVEHGRPEEPVDWRRILRDPEYRREIQAGDFRQAATEATPKYHSHQQVESTPPSSAQQADVRQQTAPSQAPERQNRREPEREEVDWRRIMKDPEYRREVQSAEFKDAAHEQIRPASISPRR